MSAAWNGRLERAPGVLVRQLGSEAVLLNLDTESYFGLDAVGARMLEVLVSEASLDAAHGVLLREFEVEPGQLKSDMQAFVRRLEAAGLVRVVEP
jgi:hypothetical protein